MREVTLPDTSLSAYRDLTPEKLTKDYKDIVSALKVLRLANYEQIAAYLGWADRNKCSRRLKEMETAQIIYKPGSKSLTSRNKSAYNYSLVSNGEQSVEPERLMKGETISDISSKMFVQNKLF